LGSIVSQGIQWVLCICCGPSPKELRPRQVGPKQKLKEVPPPLKTSQLYIVRNDFIDFLFIVWRKEKRRFYRDLFIVWKSFKYILLYGKALETKCINNINLQK